MSAAFPPLPPKHRAESSAWTVTQARRYGNPVPDHYELRDPTGGVHAHSMSREGLEALADKLTSYDEMLAALRLARAHCSEMHADVCSQIDAAIAASEGRS